MGITHSYASLQWRQPDKLKTHNHGMKCAVVTNRGNPPNPETQKHWHVHPARQLSMTFVRVGALLCATQSKIIERSPTALEFCGVICRHHFRDEAARAYLIKGIEATSEIVLWGWFYENNGWI